MTAFTLVEVLVSVTILVIIMVVLFQITVTMGNMATASRGKISAFQNARLAFSVLNDTLSRATLNSYVDYFGPKTGSSQYTFRPTNYTDAAAWVPKQFNRASELHFVSGPCTDLVPGTESASDKTNNNPGDAVFFQAPLGFTTATSFNGINRTVNSFGFYIQYGAPAAGLYPKWLANTTKANDYRFRLFEYVQPTESLKVYYSTAQTQYDLQWLDFAASPLVSGQRRARVLAEDVLLLIMRPRLSTADEKTAATALGASSYNPSTQLGSILCPNYQYDSRAWMANYPASARVTATTGSAKRVQLMTNQLPPIIDVAMICADAQSIARFGESTSTPNSKLLVQASGGTLFTDSSKMESDLNTFAQQLSANKIHFHIMRSSVQIQSSKWSNANY